MSGIRCGLMIEPSEDCYDVCVISNRCGALKEWECKNGNQRTEQVIYQKEYIVPKLEHDCDGNLVYKIDGDVKGNIEVDGKNVVIILMNGDIKGNVNLTGSDNNVVVIKGGISGNVKADKVICPEKPNSDTTSFPPPWIITFCPDTNEFSVINEGHFFWKFTKEFDCEQCAIDYFESHTDYFLNVCNDIMESIIYNHKYATVIYLSNTNRFYK